MVDDEIAPVPLAARLAWLATERAWRVLDARAGFESRLTYAAIGRELGITRGRAWQLHIDLGHRLAHPSLPPGSPAGHPGHARRRLAPARPRRPPTQAHLTLATGSAITTGAPQPSGQRVPIGAPNLRQSTDGRHDGATRSHMSCYGMP